MALLGVKCRTKGAHQPGNIRPDNIVTQLAFKAAQHCIVKEGAALHHNVLAQLLGAVNTQHLVNGIFNHADGQTGADIIHPGAVSLRLLDR